MASSHSSYFALYQFSCPSQVYLQWLAPRHSSHHLDKMFKGLGVKPWDMFQLLPHNFLSSSPSKTVFARSSPLACLLSSHIFLSLTFFFFALCFPSLFSFLQQQLTKELLCLFNNSSVSRCIVIQTHSLLA